MGFRVGAILVGCLILAAYIVGSGFWVQTSGVWYSTLQRPSWQPPNWVFGVAWPYNFSVLGVAVFVLPGKLTPSLTTVWLVSFAVSVIAALVWSQQFYGPHHLAAAAIALAVATLLTVPMLVMAFHAGTGIFLALIPYQLWLCVATSLSIGYAIKN